MSLADQQPLGLSKGGGSKLAQLAKLRAQKKQELQQMEEQTQLSESQERPVSKLETLARKRALQLKQSPTNNESILKSVAILDRLTLSTEFERKNSDRPSLVPSREVNKLARLRLSRKLQKEEKKQEKDNVEIVENAKTENPQIGTSSMATDHRVNDSEQSLLSLELAVDSSRLLFKPRSDLMEFLLNGNSTKRRYSTTVDENRKKRIRRDDLLFHTLTNISLDSEKIAKAKQNFADPSPDDKVLEAQKEAFEQGMGNLKISQAGSSSSVSKATTPETSKTVKTTKPAKKIDILEELSTNSTYAKPHKSFVVIGHVDAGKSTLMGRILFDYGIVDARTVNRLVKEAENAGKGSFALAWIMDQTAEERSHGVTVDICATDFETPTTRFTAIDAPGHKDFVPQMIGGVSQADLALLVVDSITGEFEAGFAMDGQTKEHTILAKNLGIERICVAVNKLDKEDWNEERFELIKTQLTEYLTSDEVQFAEEQIDFVPISGLSGNNVVKRDTSIAAFNWYKGPTLGHYLENVKLSSTVDTDSISKLLSEDFFVSVHDSHKDKGEYKISGKISSGVIQVGETVIAAPSEEVFKVHSLRVAKKKVDFAIRGELVEMSFKASQVSNESADIFRIGDLVSKVGSPAKTVKKFTVSLHLFNMDKPLLVGMPFVLFRNNCQVPARVSKLIEITSGKKKKKLLHLVSKQTAIVEIEVQEGSSLPLTKYSDNKILGRIVIRREGVTIGAGTVVDF